jgi:poly-gamma-glutamate biosynthesis protein PgsC/CapC
MAEQAIGLGLVISLIFSETLGLAAGGMVVPGYLALMMHAPFRIGGTVLAALATYVAMRLLSRVALVYGRRRIVIAVLIGFVFGGLSRALFPLTLQDTPLDLRAIGFVIPGLMANWMERQGTVATLLVMTTAAVLVRLLLILLNGGEPLP